MEKKVTKVLIRWRAYSDRSWFCECRPDSPDWVFWSYLGSIMYVRPNWFWRLFHHKHWYAYAFGTNPSREDKFYTKEEAMQFVEDNSVWP